MPKDAFREIQEELNGQHFSRIARDYRLLRTTDMAPIVTISEYLRHFYNLKIVDVGCGAGRYDRLLFSALGDNIELLSCVDRSKEMLKELQNYLASNGIDRFETFCGVAELLPFESSSKDVVMSFNALHHFRLEDALKEMFRVLKPGGWTFLYTRTPLQNQETIWGHFFPKFNEKETRLYSLEQLEKAAMAAGLEFEAFQFFSYRRHDTLDRLVYKAYQHHYSTFVLYDEKELELSLSAFKKNILSHFKDPSHISWIDRNVMVIARKISDNSV